ncbi:MAG TPA: PEGA domain-containing protein [Polyangiaceae bacterium]
MAGTGATWRETRRYRAVFALALSATLCVGERAAFAENPQPATAFDARKAQAKAKYEQGVELYRNERYADAVQLFLEADALSPSAALSFNIARAYEKLADDAATLRWYRNYLRLNPEAPNATEVRQSIQTLSLSLARKGVQQLTVLSTPTGATVAIDNQALGVTPLTVELKPGKHHALVTLRGFGDAAKDFTLSAPAPLDLPFELQLAQAETPPLGATTTEAGTMHSGQRRFGIVPYVTLAAGAVALGGAALFEVSRRSAEDSVQNDKTQLAAERDIGVMNSRQTTARVLLGVGGVLVATGGALFVFNTRVGPESNAGLSALPGGAAFSFRRSF